jgi:hypothetical protein
MEVAMNSQRDWHSEPEREKHQPLDFGQPDPTLQEEPASAMRVTIYAVGALVVLGLVLYGLNQPHQEITAEQSAAPPAGSSAPAPSQASGGNPPATTGAAPQEGKQDNKQDQSKPQSNQAQPPQQSEPQGNAQPNTQSQ